MCIPPTYGAAVEDGFLNCDIVVRKAVCLRQAYDMGKEFWISSEDNPSLPPGFRVGYKLQPYTGRHTRCHIQLRNPVIDEVLSTLLRLDGLDAPTTNGANFVETPCTCPAGLCNACEKRQRLTLNKEGAADRPWTIPERHAKGYKKELKKLLNVLKNIVKQDAVPKPDPSTRWKKYSGSKREHYRQCASEFAANPIRSKGGPAIFHEGSVKWGELSSRPRALLIQSQRASGLGETPRGVKLRTPIMVEGGYRDPFETALHKFCHKRGFEYCASGMDLHTRAKKIKRMVEPGDAVLSCDWSSFDGSLGWLGVWEREAFLAVCEELWGVDEALREVLRTQNFCSVESVSFRARIFGNRGSGTAGTSTANKIVVLASLFYALGPAMLGRGGVKLFCDGDDTLIIVPKKWQGARNGQGWYSSWARRLTALGLETKVEQILFPEDGDVVPRIRFCRASVIETSRGPFLCKIPSDVIKVATNIRRHFRGPYFRAYMSTLSVCLRQCYGDVPVLCELWRWFDLECTVNVSLLDNCGLEYMMQKTHTLGSADDITPIHRASFAATFGLQPSVQQHFEHLIRSSSSEVVEALKRFRL